MKKNINAQDAINLCENTIGSMNFGNVISELTKMNILSDEHMDEETKKSLSNPSELIAELKKVNKMRELEKEQQEDQNQLTEEDISKYFS